MIVSQLLYFSLSVACVSAFAPARIQSARIYFRGDVASILPRNNGQRSEIQSRTNSVSLSSMLEAGMDPMFTTLILGAALMATMALNPDDESETIFDSAKSLVAEAPPVKKEAIEIESPALTIEAAEVMEPKIEEKKEASKEPAAAKEPVVTKEPVATKVADVRPAVADVDDLVRTHAESIAVESIKKPSPAPPHENVKSNHPAAVVPPMDVEETIERATSFPAKLLVKIFMPWKKLKNI